MEQSEVNNKNVESKDHLHTMSSNEINMKLNNPDSLSPSPLKRSNIPRPNITGNVNISAGESFKTPLPLGPPSIAPTFNKKELGQIQREISDKEAELATLRSDLRTIRTRVQKLELDREELKEKFSMFSKKRNTLENVLLGIKEDEEKMLKDLKRDHELKLKELDIDFDQSKHETTKFYNMHYEKLKKEKIDELVNTKNVLHEKLESLQNDIDGNEGKYQELLKQMENNYKSQSVEIKKLMQESRDDYEEELKKLVNESKDLESLISESQNELKDLNELQSKKTEQLNSLKLKNSSSSKDTKDIISKISALKAALLEQKTQINELEQDMSTKNEQIIKNNELFYQEEEIRRKFHNRLQELKGNIRVFCRVRPPISSEIGSDIIDIKVPDNDEEEQEIEVRDPRSSTPPITTNTNTNNITTLTSSFNSNAPSNLIKKANFKFDKVFQMDSTNSEIFDEISQLVQTAIYGFNVCIFAYGQTGSGKTYTMSNEDGMIPRAIDQIFEIKGKLNQNNDWEHRIYGEFLEIYNETINDLLDDSNTTTNSSSKYEIRHDYTNEKTSITDLTQIELTSPQMMKDLLLRVYHNRSIAATKLNERSSRSHSVYIIRIEGVNHKTGETTSGVLNLIDLAGSERLSNSQVVGDRLKETQSINKSLSCLGDVIYALNDASGTSAGSNGNNGRHIPFRNSKLTYLLQFSLLGNSKTLMFVNVSPLVKNYSETVNSLRFAMKVHNTKLKR